MNKRKRETTNSFCFDFIWDLLNWCVLIAYSSECTIQWRQWWWKNDSNEKTNARKRKKIIETAKERCVLVTSEIGNSKKIISIKIYFDRFFFRVVVCFFCHWFYMVSWQSNFLPFFSLQRSTTRNEFFFIVLVCYFDIRWFGASV